LGVSLARSLKLYARSVHSWRDDLGIDISRGGHNELVFRLTASIFCARLDARFLGIRRRGKSRTVSPGAYTAPEAVVGKEMRELYGSAVDP
jgi:hypothetical protein